MEDIDDGLLLEVLGNPFAVVCQKADTLVLHVQEDVLRLFELQNFLCGLLPAPYCCCPVLAAQKNRAIAIARHIGMIR